MIRKLMSPPMIHRVNEGFILLSITKHCEDDILFGYLVAFKNESMCINIVRM